MCPSLVKIQYTELKLSCGNDPVVRNYIYSNGDLDLWPNDPKNMFFPFHRGIMWSRLVKIQYTELKLSCGNDPVVKNSIYSNSDLDLRPNDPKINRVLPLPQGNHMTSLVKIQYTELKLCGNDPVVRNYIYSNGDLDLWPNNPKINRAFPTSTGESCGQVC